MKIVYNTTIYDKNQNYKGQKLTEYHFSIYNKIEFISFALI